MRAHLEPSRPEITMQTPPPLRFSYPRARGTKLFAAMAALFIALASASVAPPAAAQTEYDFNGDGRVTCADFEEEFPETFTDEATAALAQYPDELRRLSRDSAMADVACEGQPGDAAPAEASRSRETPERQPEDSEAAASGAEPGNVPAEVMARVAGCSVVAISARDVVGAGCPGVGTVTFRIPDGAPAMEGTVLFSPGAPAAGAAAAPETTDATRANREDPNEGTTTRANRGNQDDGTTTRAQRANRNDEPAPANDEANDAQTAERRNARPSDDSEQAGSKTNARQNQDNEGTRANEDTRDKTNDTNRKAGKDKDEKGNKKNGKGSAKKQDKRDGKNDKDRQNGKRDGKGKGKGKKNRNR
jgi:hypothetical protein